MPKGKARILIGAKGTHGCSGYPVVGAEGKVHGCHPTEAAARQQQAAIYASQSREAKKNDQSVWVGFFYPEMQKADPSVELGASTTETENGGYEDCGCPTCKLLNVPCEECPVCQSNEMKSDCCGNMEKKNPCWDGYVQRGMKEKDGKMVPNCVPVEKSTWGGTIFDLNPFVK